MNPIKILDIVKSGGAIVLAAMLALMLWNLLGNHISHNTEALIELKESSIMETSAINSLIDVTKDVKENNIDLTKAIDRFSYLIETLTNE